MHMCTLIYTNMCTHIHTCLYTYIHITHTHHAHTYVQTHMHAPVRASTHTYNTYTYRYACTHVHTHTQMHTHIHTYTHLQTCIYTCTHIHTHITNSIGSVQVLRIIFEHFTIYTQRSILMSLVLYKYRMTSSLPHSHTNTWTSQMITMIPLFYLCLVDTNSLTTRCLVTA